MDSWTRFSGFSSGSVTLLVFVPSSINIYTKVLFWRLKELIWIKHFKQLNNHQSLKHRNSSPLLSFCWWLTAVQSCPTDPTDRSTPGLPVHHQLLEVTQTHVHGAGDAIQPSHPLSSPSPPAFNLSQHQGLFKWGILRTALVLQFKSLSWVLKQHIQLTPWHFHSEVTGTPKRSCL